MKTCRRVCSVCSGAYILAQTGVLDDKRATTHWGRTPDFQKRFPNVKLEPDCIYTRDGKVWTSAGITAGIDLALALIADDLGEEVSRRSAQELWSTIAVRAAEVAVLGLLDISARRRFTPFSPGCERSTPPAVEAWPQSNMSPRNFARAFTAETGVTRPAAERLRLEWHANASTLARRSTSSPGYRFQTLSGCVARLCGRLGSAAER
jgi:transcriptional regulator GlxA family with amidase domain